MNECVYLFQSSKQTNSAIKTSYGPIKFFGVGVPAATPTTYTYRLFDTSKLRKNVFSHENEANSNWFMKRRKIVSNSCLVAVAHPTLLPPPPHTHTHTPHTDSCLFYTLIPNKFFFQPWKEIKQTWFNDSWHIPALSKWSALPHPTPQLRPKPGQCS